jgi:hypothetical protein
MKKYFTLKKPALYAITGFLCLIFFCDTMHAQKKIFTNVTLETFDLPGKSVASITKQGMTKLIDINNSLSLAIQNNNGEKKYVLMDGAKIVLPVISSDNNVARSSITRFVVGWCRMIIWEEPAGDGTSSTVVKIYWICDGKSSQ